MFTQQDGWYNDEFYQTQYRILQSRSLARKAVKTMQLGAHPAYKRMISTPPPMTLTGAATAAYSAVKTAIVGAAPSDRAARDDPAADGVGRDRAGSGAGRFVPRRADRGAGPQQPPGGAPLHVERAAAGRRHGQRAGEDLHRAEPRVQVPLLEGRDRLAVGADGRAAEEGRGERGRSSSATRSSTTPSPSRIARTSSCSVSAR